MAAPMKCGLRELTETIFHGEVQMNWKKKIAKTFHALTTRKLPLCPYCLEPVNIKSALYRCTNKAKLCAHAPDDVYKSRWDDGRLMGKVLSPGSNGLCDCGHRSRYRICPHCHMKLELSPDGAGNIMLAVLGAKNSGKSHYLSVLINQLKVTAHDLGGSYEHVGETTIRRYKERFYDPLFRQKKILDGTVGAAANFEVRIPLIYRMSLQDKDRRRIRKVVDMYFFDTAGEDLDDVDQMANLNKYIAKSDGIVLLVDPLQVSAIVQQVNGMPNAAETFTEPVEILTRVRSLITDEKDLDALDKVDVPLAVAFSKIDAIKDVLGPTSHLNAKPRHKNGFDINDFNAMSSELESLLERENEKALHAAVCTHFSRYGFFGVSALGHSPDEAGNVGTIAPHRVEDPILWLLSEHEVIPRVIPPRN
jgi:GTP-binding protein EngB required for normal cell division